MRLNKSNSFESNPRRDHLDSNVVKNVKNSRQANRPSDEVIRKIVDDRKIKSLRKKASAQKLKEMHDEIKENPDTENPDYQLKGDVGLNHPQDPNTKEKLKSILRVGAFNFSEKEKAALGKILQD